MWNKTLIKNFSALTLVQIANYAIPLLLIPYISRIIGISNYGKLEYARTFVFYFTVLINYGFDYTATREISINRTDKDKLEKIISEVYSTKVILFTISSILFFLFIYFDSSLNELSNILWLTYAINIGFVLFPLWIFQGLEKISSIAIINFIIKFAVLSLTFLLLKHKDDYWIYNFLQSISQISIGIVSLLIVRYYYKMSFGNVKFSGILSRFKSGFSVFASMILVNIFASYSFIILKGVSSETDIGIYATAFKLAITIQTIIILPFSQAFFPHMALKAENNILDFKNYIKKISRLLSVVMLIICLLSILFAEPIISLIFGDDYLIAVPTFRILAFLPIFSALTNLYSYQGLLNLKKDKLFLYIHIFATLIVVLLSHILVPKYGLIGASYLRIFSEILLMITSFVFYKIHIKKASYAS
ncbi:MAG TPA: flippase [Flavobacteriaceae bacterium]|nr:flippase [Flavobacteriaceae bacterium]